MPDKILLYQFPPVREIATTSPFCLKVHAALNHKKVPFEVRNLLLPPQIARVSPTKKLPILEHNGRRLVDSTDILQYIEQQWPDPPLKTVKPAEEALARLIEDWADESLFFSQLWMRWVSPEGFARVGEMLFSDSPPGFKQIAPILARRKIVKQLDGQGLGRKQPEAIRRDFHAQLDWIDSLLEAREWLVGGRMSWADVGVGAQLAGIHPEWLPAETSAIKERKNLDRWRTRMAPLFRQPGS